MKKRQIKYPKGEDGKSKLFEELTMKEKRELLVLDEIRILAAQGKAKEGIETRNIKYTVPQSEEMKELVATINSSQLKCLKLESRGLPRHSFDQNVLLLSLFDIDHARRCQRQLICRLRGRRTLPNKFLFLLVPIQFFWV